MTKRCVDNSRGELASGSPPFSCQLPSHSPSHFPLPSHLHLHLHLLHTRIFSNMHSLLLSISSTFGLESLLARETSEDQLDSHHFATGRSPRCGLVTTVPYNERSDRYDRLQVYNKTLLLPIRLLIHSLMLKHT